MISGILTKMAVSHIKAQMQLTDTNKALSVLAGDLKINNSDFTLKVAKFVH